MRTTVRTTDQGTDKKIQKLIDDYEDIFQGIGKYKGDPVKIQVREGIQPVIQPPRRIPIHYRKPLQDHLEELIQGDVIEGPLQEEEEGTWISNLVITDKKWEGKPEENRVQIRANVDLRPLNQYVYQTHEQFPTFDELRHDMKGSDTFSKLDMVHSFHQFELEESARKLFAFRTPWGLYRFKRLVMGNSPASSECHKRVREVVAGLPGVLQIKDDVLIHGKGEEHDERLKSVLQRFREAGLTLRKEKCELKRSQVKWFGMVFSKEGMAPDPDKVQVIKNWKPPKTVRQVKSFLQTVQFNAAYMGAETKAELSYTELTAPLRALTKKGQRFKWTKVHQRHFDMIKERLCSDKVMVAYDPGRETRIYTDGGPEGAQATVTQKYRDEQLGEQWRPVAHTARAWTETEKGYSQIEKESNALCTGISANRPYLLGKNFQAAVDHKPLLPLYNKINRPKQIRVDRHRTKLAGYKFEVIHVPGDSTPCDYGSRAGCPEPREYTEQEKEDWAIEEEDEIFVSRIMEEQVPQAITWNMVQRATKEDPQLKMLMEDIRKGTCRKALTRYTKIFNELSIIDEVIVRGEQILIPEDMQEDVIKLAHEGHTLGHEKTIRLLRESCWFPAMGEKVKKFIETCKPCQAADPRTEQEPLHPTMMPEGPWQIVHADFKGPIGGKWYVHTFIDQFSKYPIVEICKSTSWDKMLPQLQRITSLWGYMDTIITDGGPPYDGQKFKEYMIAQGIHHHICTPENPQANGFVEVFQKVIVKVIHTAMIEKEDPKAAVEKYLMTYRAAPHKTTGKSPYELMFRRKMKTKLPLIRTRQDTATEKEARERHDTEKLKQKERHDKKHKAMEKDIQQGDKVMIKRKKTTLDTPWDPEEFTVKEVKGAKLTLARQGELNTELKTMSRY